MPFTTIRWSTFLPLLLLLFFLILLLLLYEVVPPVVINPLAGRQAPHHCGRLHAHAALALATGTLQALRGR